MDEWWDESLPSRASRRPDLPSETLEAGSRLVVQVPVALEYWMDEDQHAYVLETLHQRLHSEMGMRGFRVDSVRIKTGVALDPTDRLRRRTAEPHSAGGRAAEPRQRQWLHPRADGGHR